MEHFIAAVGTVLATAGLVLPVVFHLNNRLETRLTASIDALEKKLDDHDRECHRRGLNLENRLTRLEAKP